MRSRWLKAQGLVGVAAIACGQEEPVAAGDCDPSAVIFDPSVHGDANEWHEQPNLIFCKAGPCHKLSPHELDELTQEALGLATTRPGASVFFEAGLVCSNAVGQDCCYVIATATIDI